MYACINCLNKSSVGVRGGTEAGVYAKVAFRLADKRVEVIKSVLKELELLERVDLLKSSLA